MEDLPGELSMEQAVQLTLKNNYDILVAEKRIDDAELKNDWGNAGRWPQITLDGNSRNSFSDRRNPASALGKAQVLNIEGAAGINLNWQLFAGFRTYVQKDRLELLEEQSQGNAELVVENNIQAVKIAYYDALIAREKLGVLRETVEFSKDRLEYVRNRKALGQASTFDVLQERIAYKTDQSNLERQQLAYENAKRNLAQLMGIQLPVEAGQAMDYTLSDSLRLDTTDYSFANLRDRMQNVVDIENQYIALEILKQDIKFQETQKMPTLSMNVGAEAAPSYGRITGGRFESSGGGTNFNYFANFTLSFNLFDGGRVRQAIESAQISKRIGQLNLQQMEHQLAHRLRRTLATYNTRKRLVQIVSSTVKDNRTNRKLARQRFRQGTINSFDYREIQLNYLRAEVDRLEAIYNLLIAEINLQRLAGGLMQDYQPE